METMQEKKKPKAVQPEPIETRLFNCINDAISDFATKSDDSVKLATVLGVLDLVHEDFKRRFNPAKVFQSQVIQD